MEHHEDDDNNDHFPDMEGEETDVRDGEEGFSHHPVFLDRLNGSCTGKREGPLVAVVVVVTLRDIPAMGRDGAGIPDITGIL